MTSFNPATYTPLYNIVQLTKQPQSKRTPNLHRPIYNLKLEPTDKLKAKLNPPKKPVVAPLPKPISAISDTRKERHMKLSLLLQGLDNITQVVAQTFPPAESTKTVPQPAPQTPLVTVYLPQSAASPQPPAPAKPLLAQPTQTVTPAAVKAHDTAEEEFDAFLDTVTNELDTSGYQTPPRIPSPRRMVPMGGGDFPLPSLHATAFTPAPIPRAAAAALALSDSDCNLPSFEGNALTLQNFNASVQMSSQSFTTSSASSTHMSATVHSATIQITHPTSSSSFTYEEWMKLLNEMGPNEFLHQFSILEKVMGSDAASEKAKAEALKMQAVLLLK